MIINNITIENFQSYYDVHSLDFSKGLNLIIGKGGKGKSKLFNAFYWVLFGRIYVTGVGWCSTEGLSHSAKFSMDKYEFINKKALYEAYENEEVKSSVAIEIEDDDKILYRIERSTYAKRLNSDEWDTEDAWEVRPNILKVSFDDPRRGGTRILDDIMAEDKINELFPEGIRNYIWFQGEALETLINFRNKETLKSAVKHISYFPYYEKLSDIVTKSKVKIERIESRKLKEVNKKNTTVNNLLADKDLLNYKIEKEEENKSQIESNIELINMKLAADDKKMSGLAKYSSLIGRYKECEKKIIELNNNIESIDKFQREQLPKLWLLRGVESMIKESKDIIENHRKEEDTLPEKKYLDNPSRPKLEEILKDEKCFVCGSDVSKDSKPYQWIMNRLKEQDEYLREMEDYKNNMQLSKQFNMFIGKIQDYPDSLLISLAQIDKQYRDSEDNLEKNMALRRKEIDKKSSFDQDIEEVKKKKWGRPYKRSRNSRFIKFWYPC